MIPRAIACLALAAVLAGASLAQQPSPPPTEIRVATERLRAGDLEGAIAILEPLRGRADASPLALSLLGGLYVQAGRAAEALAILEPLVRAEPADPALLYNAGRAALALDKIDDALSYWHRSLARDPVSPATRELGLLYARLGAADRALPLLAEWVVTDPADLEARLAGATAALALHRTADAEALLSGVPNDRPEVVLMRARIALQAGQPQAAVQLLAPLAAAPPKASERELLRLLGEAYVRTAKPEATVTLLAGRTDQDPGLALLLAEAHGQLRQGEAAVAALRPLAERLPANGDNLSTPHRWLAGVLARELGRYLAATGARDEALKWLEHATRLDPDNAQTWRLHAELLSASGRTAEATAADAKAKALEKAATPTAPAAPTVAADPVGQRLSESMKLARQGNGEGALAAIREARQAAPTDLRPYFVEVQTLLLLRRFDEALSAAEATLKVAPENADASYQRGVARLALGDLAGAESDFRSALARAPTHIAAKSDLAVLLITRQRQDEARQLLIEILAADPGNARARSILESLGPGSD